MKFDFIIGNPPYQEDAIGDNKNFTPPVYHKFIDEVYCVGNKVELIHPARFLFDAGATPKEWNRKMLNDPHFKVVYYEPKSGNVFSGPDIRGGVAITYHDKTKNFVAIEIYTVFEELNTILQKVKACGEFKSLSAIVFSRTEYRLTPLIHQDYPNAKDDLSNGHLFDMSTNIFDCLPYIFHDKKPQDTEEYVRICGLVKAKDRVSKWIRRRYIKEPKNFTKYKVFVPKSNGSGSLGEVLSTPLIGQPLIGHTETFISIGCFDTEAEAQSALKYIKTKFARGMLGVLKITQDNPPEKWKYVPLQDFTDKSDIDWSQSIAEIDQQLYKKYGLDEKEITFIETHVKEMS